ncbi:PQQ-dependent sugar dehydrogenase [Sphingomonas oryzagri]
MKRALVPLALAVALTSCGEKARQDITAGEGPNPNLVPEVHHLIPTVSIAEIIGWKADEAPTPAPGLKVDAFARGLDHPRWLLVLPNGDVLVAETNAPPKPDDNVGIKGRITKIFMKKAGGASPSANRITLLRDANGDGVADQKSVFISGLNSPFGMALVGDTLYVADTDALLAFPYRTGETRIAGTPHKVTDLPAGPINHHWTKNVIASPDGSKLYVTIGSNSNVGERGIAAEKDRAQIWEVDPRTGAHKTYPGGIRNPNGMAWTPDGMLWTVSNERDELGSDLVPDYLAAVEPGVFYGWPWRYWGDHVDKRVKDPAPDYIDDTRKPDYALGAHTASLGLTFADGSKLGPAFAHGAFVGQHGSWNRKPPSGYKVVFVPFAGSRPTGAKPVDVLTGFLSPDGEQTHGRPVGVTIAGDGALLVADDGGNAIWRVTAATPAGPSAPSKR